MLLPPEPVANTLETRSTPDVQPSAEPKPKPKPRPSATVMAALLQSTKNTLPTRSIAQPQVQPSSLPATSSPPDMNKTNLAMVDAIDLIVASLGGPSSPTEHHDQPEHESNAFQTGSTDLEADAQADAQADVEADAETDIEADAVSEANNTVRAEIEPAFNVSRTRSSAPIANKRKATGPITLKTAKAAKIAKERLFVVPLYRASNSRSGQVKGEVISYLIVFKTCSNYLAA
jgi:hypothetical protein